MKKFLNVLGVLGSIILTFILTILIFIYIVILNVKSVVSEKGLANSLKKVDVVDVLKSTEDGVMWEDFMQLAETLNLSEKQFELILDNDEFKEEIGEYIGEVISSSFNDKTATLTKERIENILNIAVDEYNKVSETKITDEERKKIVNSFDEEMIENVNEQIGSLNLKETVEPEYVTYIQFLDNVLYGNYSLILLITIIIVIGLIALFRFSCYKWMSYVKVSAIINGIIMLLVGGILLIIPLQDMEILLPLKQVIVTNIFITAIILFVISIVLTISKKYIKKFIENKNNLKEEPKKENVKKEEKKKLEKKVDNKKKIEVDKKTIIIIGLILLVVILIVLFFVFKGNGSYTITFDTNGGTKISSIEVKNNEIVKLPDVPKKEGHTFIGWTNEDGNIVTKGTKVTEDITLKAEWISDDAESVTTIFDTDGGNEIDDIIIEKGKIILLPVEPERDGYIFVGWVDGDGNLVTDNLIVNNKITLKAMWIKKDAKTIKVEFNTNGGNKIKSIVIEKGKKILLPIKPLKEGYVFAGWVDENGKEITKDSLVDEDIIIKATWKEPYTCPKDCIPTGDGSKCTKTSIKDLVVNTGCPSGTETIEKFCSSHKRQVTVGFDEDQTVIDAGIFCDGNPTGYCVDYNNKYTISGESCPSGYFKYTYSESGLDALYGCAKRYEKGGTSCPSGYTQDDNKCTKVETIKCTAN